MTSGSLGTHITDVHQNRRQSCSNTARFPPIASAVGPMAKSTQEMVDKCAAIVQECDASTKSNSHDGASFDFSINSLMYNTSFSKPCSNESDQRSTITSSGSIPDFLFQLTKMLTDNNRDIIEWSNGRCPQGN
jgi:hypothetical protein